MNYESIFRNTTLLLSGLLFMACEKPKTLNPEGTEPPITLDCNYFKNNPNAVLKDNPEAPVDYIVTCIMSIEDDVTIEPGVTIAFQPDAGLNVKSTGSLKAAGASSKKITFTGTESIKGHWAGILFYSNSSKNEISNAVVEYAGSKGIGSGDLAAIKLYNPTSSVARAKITHNVIQYNKYHGIAIETKNAEATITGNTFKENDKPIKLHVQDVNLLDKYNFYEDNGVNKIHLYCYAAEFHGDKLWQRAAVPYLLYNGSASLGFEIAGNLTVESGTIIEMSAGSYIKVREAGSLKMVGESNNYITIRGVENTPGFWKRIHFDRTTHPNNILKYVKIQNAGNDPTATKGAIYMWAKPMVTAEFVEFTDVLTCAFYSAPLSSGSSVNPNLTTSNITYINTGGEICGD